MRHLAIIALLVASLLTRLEHATNAQEPQEPFEGCELVNQMERLAVYFAPMTHTSQLMTFLPEGAEYKMFAQSFSSFLIEFGDGERGWLEWHQRTVNGMCSMMPRIERPIADYPTVCSFLPDAETPLYEDQTLTEPNPMFERASVRPYPYPVSAITRNAVYFFLSDHLGGGWIDRDAGQLNGHCVGTIQLVTTTQETRLWTLPSVREGQVATTIPSGTTLGAQLETVSGPIHLDRDDRDDWYQVRHGDLIAWAWTGNLEPGRTFTAPLPAIGKAEVLEGANLWTEPDATTGELVTTLFPGSTVNITGDPVSGPILTDGDEQGQWLPVQQGGAAGWVWIGRLAIADEG